MGYTTLNKYGVFENKDEYNYSAARTPEGYIEKKYSFTLTILGSADTSSQWYLDDEGAHDLLIVYLTQRFGDPAEYNGLPLSNMSLQLVDEFKWSANLEFSNTDQGQDDYDEREPVPSGETPIVGVQNIQFNFSTIQTHINRSLSTVGSYYLGTAPIDFGGKINVDSSGVCQGLDLIKPEMCFSITVNHAADAITPSVYFPTIFGAIGSVNSAAWGIFAAGTCLFMGADISNQKYSGNDSVTGEEYRENYWQAVYNFKFNAGGYVTTPTGGSVFCEGWDYSWGYTTKGVQGETLEQVNIERVYPRADFLTLFPWSWDI